MDRKNRQLPHGVGICGLTVALAREIESSTHFAILPGKFEIHELSIMREFCDSGDNGKHRDQLLEAIHGSEAFRFFHSTLNRLGLNSVRHNNFQRNWGVPLKPMFYTFPAASDAK